MIKYTSRIAQVIMMISLIAAVTSCTTPTPMAKPGAPAYIESAPPAIIDIVGVREWKPLQEGSLICVCETEATLTYSWSAEKGSIKGAGKQVTWAAPELPGDYAVMVKVTNTQGKEATFSKNFKVTNNPYNNDTPDRTIYLQLSLPSSTMVSEKSHPKIWTTSEIECTVTGADESNLTYQWTAQTGKLAGNGLAEGKAKRVGWISPGVAGLYKVSVIVSDKSGNKASGEVSFDVYCCKE
jgi:hypothetical protein